MDNAILKLLIVFSHAAAITFLLIPLMWFTNFTTTLNQVQNQQPEPYPLYSGIGRLF